MSATFVTVQLEYMSKSYRQTEEWGGHKRWKLLKIKDDALIPSDFRGEYCSEDGE